MKDLKEIIIFYDAFREFSVLSLANDLLERMPDLLEPVILPIQKDKPFLFFNTNEDIKIEVDTKCVRIILSNKYFKNLSSITFDVIDAFEGANFKFTRIGYITSLIFSEKYINIYKKHYLNMDNIKDELELNLSWYKKINLSDIELNCWNKIFTNNKRNDLLVQYDINTPLDKSINIDMKFLREFFSSGEEYIEETTL